MFLYPIGYQNILRLPLFLHFRDDDHRRKNAQAAQEGSCRKCFPVHQNSHNHAGNWLEGAENRRVLRSDALDADLIAQYPDQRGRCREKDCRSPRERCEPQCKLRGQQRHDKDHRRRDGIHVKNQLEIFHLLQTAFFQIDRIEGIGDAGQKGQRHAENAPSAFAVIEQQDAAEAERYAQQLQRADLFLKKNHAPQNRKNRIHEVYGRAHAGRDEVIRGEQQDCRSAVTKDRNQRDFCKLRPRNAHGNPLCLQIDVKNRNRKKKAVKGRADAVAAARADRLYKKRDKPKKNRRYHGRQEALGPRIHKRNLSFQMSKRTPQSYAEVPFAFFLLFLALCRLRS